MKNIFSILLSLFITILFLDSCKKDDKDNPCASITCENGGTCNNGTCDCPSGYSGNKCQTLTNPCANVTCLNGGTCSVGICNCPAGYTGANCGTQKTPTKIRVVKIEVNGFPATDNGAGWDLTSGADIYPAIYRVSPSAFVWESDTYIENAAANLTHTFIPNPPVLINPNVEYLFALFDYDYPDSDDAIGGVSLIINYNGFPNVIDVSASDMLFTIYVEYVF
jgi:hypothetical protein